MDKEYIKKLKKNHNANTAIETLHKAALNADADDLTSECFYGYFKYRFATTVQEKEEGLIFLERAGRKGNILSAELLYNICINELDNEKLIKKWTKIARII